MIQTIFIILCCLFCLLFSLILFLKVFFPNSNAITGLDDIKQLGTPNTNVDAAATATATANNTSTTSRTKHKKHRHHAVVCGGSVAGLICARVLLDHFEKVTIIEKDDIQSFVTSDNPYLQRNCVPQQNFTHGIYSQLMGVLEKLFPGLFDYYMQQGAHYFDFGDIWWFSYVGFLCQHKSGLTVVGASRVLIEHGIRRFLYKEYTQRITTLCGSVTALIQHADVADRVDGVCVRIKDSNVVSEVHADFVVDATGRVCKGVKWLQELGYGEAPRYSYDAFITYAARTYKKPEIAKTENWAKLNAFYQHPHKGARNGYLSENENDRILVTLTGLSKEAPTSSNFDEWSAGLATPFIHNAQARMEPITSVQCFKPGKSQIVHYHKIKTPSNFAVVGDSLAHFNPIYGQGLYMAALGSITLDAVFREASKHTKDDEYDISKRYFSKMRWRMLIAWLLPLSLDQEYPLTSPRESSVLILLLRKIIPLVYTAACHSTLVHQTFLKLLTMSASPLAFVDPFVFWQIAKVYFTKPNKV